jgi:hypothetical protein
MRTEVLKFGQEDAHSFPEGMAAGCLAETTDYAY